MYVFKTLKEGEKAADTTEVYDQAPLKNYDAALHLAMAFTKMERGRIAFKKEKGKSWIIVFPPKEDKPKIL